MRCLLRSALTLAVRPKDGCWATMWLVIGTGTLGLSQLYLALLGRVPTLLGIAWNCTNSVWFYLGLCQLNLGLLGCTSKPTWHGTFFGIGTRPIGDDSLFSLGLCPGWDNLGTPPMSVFSCTYFVCIMYACVLKKQQTSKQTLSSSSSSVNIYI